MAWLLRLPLGVASSPAPKPDTTSPDSVSNLNTYRLASCYSRVSIVVAALFALALSEGCSLGGDTSSGSIESLGNTVSMAAFIADVTNRITVVGLAENVDGMSADPARRKRTPGVPSVVAQLRGRFDQPRTREEHHENTSYTVCI